MSMQSIMSASMSLTKIQAMQSANTQTQGKVNVLKAEIKQDRGNKDKEEQVKGLEEHLANNVSQMMENVTDVNKELIPSEEERAKEAAKEKESKTDKLELSKDRKTEVAKGQEGSKGISAGTPVTYKPEGDHIRVTPQVVSESTVAETQSSNIQ